MHLLQVLLPVGAQRKHRAPAAHRALPRVLRWHGRGSEVALEIDRHGSAKVTISMSRESFGLKHARLSW